MSTTYHQLRTPFSSVNIAPGPGHTSIGIWVNGAKTGCLVVRNEELPDVLRAISCQEELDNKCAAIRINGRVRVQRDIKETTCLVSEYGELTSLKKLREGEPRA